MTTPIAVSHTGINPPAFSVVVCGVGLRVEYYPHVTLVSVCCDGCGDVYISWLSPSYGYACDRCAVDAPVQPASQALTPGAETAHDVLQDWLELVFAHRGVLEAAIVGSSVVDVVGELSLLDGLTQAQSETVYAWGRRHAKRAQGKFE